MSNDFLSFLGWAFLPDFISTNLQFLYYKLTIRTGDPVPQPGTPRHATHRRRIYITVILCYLCYTLYEADWDVRRAGDFYSQLAVDHDVEEKALQSRFRRLTLQFHPDKLPQSTTAAERAEAESRYVNLQLARDTLIDPAKRFAYDRFGPDVTQWKQCKTIKDFVYVGVRGLIPFYVGSSIFMVILGWMGFGDWGQYWRYLAVAALATVELHTVTRPTFTFITQIPTLPLALFPSVQSLPFPFPLLARLINTATANSFATLATRKPYLPFQALRVAHRAMIAFFIAMGRLGPLLAAVLQQGEAGAVGVDADEEEGDMKEETTRKAVDVMERAVAISCGEAARLLGLELVPFLQDGEGVSAADTNTTTYASGEVGAGARVMNSQARGEMGYLREKVKDWFVTNTIRNDQEVQEAVEAVIERRKRRAAGDDGEDVDGSAHT